MSLVIVPSDLPCGIVQTDAQGSVTAANDEVGRLSGTPVSEILQRPLDQLLTNASRIFFESHVGPLLHREGRVAEIYLRLKGPQDSQVPVLVTARSLDPPGTGHLWVLFESRQRSEFERELIQAREQMQTLAQDLKTQLEVKQKLLTILGHDLRGPVGSAAQLIDLVVEELASGEPIDEPLTIVQRTMHGTYSLIENLLGWIEGQGQSSTAACEPVVVFDLLQTVVTWLESQAKAKFLILAVDCPTTLTVQTDGRATETIVRNLVSNAIKYSSPGQKVLLKAHATSDNWTIEVCDHGLGLSPETLAGLFGESRVDSSLGTAQEKGCGLGLMFCSDLARKLGGRLSAENNVEQGCTFRLTCPRPTSS